MIDQRTITLNQNLIDVSSQNLNLVVTLDQFNDIVLGNIAVKRGCISELRYESNNNLTHIILKNPSESFGTSDIVNMNDFQERFQDAANFGHEVSFCLNVVTKKMSMLNLRPCKCLCKN